MVKLGQVYIGKLTNIERTVVAIDGQNEDDIIILKVYYPEHRVLYLSCTVKQLKECCTLKEETKWQSTN